MSGETELKMHRAQLLRVRDVLLEKTAVGELWKPERDGLRCFACGHRCYIPEGHDGVCKVRSNRGGKLLVPWGYVAGIQADPIEKKPFFHAFPGERALSFGMLGCDFHCSYCQNWVTSQVLRDVNSTARAETVTAQQLIEYARATNARVLTSTYNEPLITSEWAIHIFKLAKQQGFTTSYVSNGNATPEVLEYIRPHVDLYKVDLKSFSDKHYRSLGGVLKNVTDSISQIYKLGFWLEIVTLLIPGFNDDPAELKDLCDFMAGISPLIPWHVTAYHPDYKMETSRTLPEHLMKAQIIGQTAGLKYIYLGNLPGQLGTTENTYCHNCNTELIRRHGFKLLENRLQKGHCPNCQTEIPGRW